MLRMNIRLPRSAARLVLCLGTAWLASVLAGPALAATSRGPAILVLPMAADESVPSASVSRLATALTSELKSAGARAIAAAASAPATLASREALRGAAATAGASAVLTSEITRTGTGVHLALAVHDGASGAIVWRSALEQPNVDGLRAYLGEVLRDAVKAASAAAESARPAAAETPRAAAPPVATVPPSESAAPAKATAKLVAPPVLTVAPEDAPAVVLNSTPRIEAPVPLAVAAAPVMPSAQSYPFDVAIRDFDVCHLGATAPIAFAIADAEAARLWITDGTRPPTSAASVESRSLETFVSVDCADVDGDGIDELAITGRRNGGFRSRVFKVNDGGQRIGAIGEEVPFAVRAAAIGGGKRAFFAQDFPLPGRLYGPIRAVEVRDGRVLLGRELELVADANVGALALGLPGPQGTEGTLTIDGDARLRLVARGRVAWTGPAHYGGYDVSFETAERLQSTTGSLPRVFLRDRIEVVEHGTSPLVFLTEIESPLGNVLPNLNVGRDVTVTAMRWNGQGFAPIPVPFGYSPASIGEATLRDIRVTDVTGDRVPDLVLAVVDSEGALLSFSTAASRLLVFPGTALTDAAQSAQ